VGRAFFRFETEAGRGATATALSLGELLETDRTDVFSLEIYDILGSIAKNTCRLIFFQYDRGAVYINFQRILFRNVQCPAQLNG
jgi:hypothetical protein